MEPGPVIAASARKHSVAGEDMRHALRNPVRVFELDDDLTMIIDADRSGNLLEVGLVAGDPAPVIVHAMRARAKFLREEGDH